MAELERKKQESVKQQKSEEATKAHDFEFKEILIEFQWNGTELALLRFTHCAEPTSFL